MTAQVMLAPSDIREIGEGLNEVCASQRRRFFFTNIDYDFHIDAESLEWQPDDDISVGFWHGEPYDLMRGFKFVVRAQDLSGFALALVAEAAR